MHHALFALPLLASTMAFAHAPVQPPAFTLNHRYALGQAPFIPSNIRASCPVGIAAEQEATGATQWIVSLEDTRNSPRMPSGKMGVHLSLAAFGDRKISTARVEVSYLMSPSGVLLVDSNQISRTKTFDLSAGDEPTKQLERSLLIGSGVSITRVRLLGFTYADGSEWQYAGSSNCSVRISHVLRVATR